MMLYEQIAKGFWDSF